MKCQHANQLNMSRIYTFIMVSERFIYNTSKSFSSPNSPNIALRRLDTIINTIYNCMSRIYTFIIVSERFIYNTSNHSLHKTNLAVHYVDNY